MLIGIDIGTTNVKAVAVNDAGEICASAEKRNNTLSPQNGWSEQEPEALFQNVKSVLQETLKNLATKHPSEAIQGIVFSSAMHGLLAVDVSGQPLTNVYLWSDLRADAVSREIRSTRFDIYQRTGVPIHPMSPLCKLIWLRQNRSDIFKKAHKFLGIKEFVWYRLSGKFESDLSCASATGFMNIHENNWDAEALALAGITEAQLPSLVSPSHIGLIGDSFSAVFPGEYRDIPLIIGASDGALANLGSGATLSGQVAVTIGTSAAIRSITVIPYTDDQMRSFCYRLDEQRCIVGGASNNGTNVLEWLRNVVFKSNESAAQFTAEAAAAPPGSDGLAFLPYVQGERAPLWNAQARGAFQGLSTQHSRAHFIRAAMEGVLFNLKIIAGNMPVQSLHAGGGFSNNTFWLQMLADIFQKPVYTNNNGLDASVSGAVRFGRNVLGLSQFVENERYSVVNPQPEYAALYQQAFVRFQQ